MKTQMKFAKILSLSALIISAVAFVLSLGLCTDIAKLDLCISLSKDLGMTIKNADIYDLIQPYNMAFTVLAIIVIIACVLLYIFRMTRRKYYISNHIATAITGTVLVGTALYNIIKLVYWHIYYANIDFAAIQYMNQMLPAYGLKWTESTFFIDINIVAQILVLACGVLVFVNLIWKIRLMKFEDNLLGGNTNE